MVAAGPWSAALVRTVGLELPLVDELVFDRRLEYILGLQEVPVMAMADGYARSLGRPGVLAVVPGPGVTGYSCPTCITCQGRAGEGDRLCRSVTRGQRP